MIEKSINDIHEALIDQIKETVNGLKTVAMYRSDYNDLEISQLTITAPFALLHYVGLFPVDAERLQSGETGIVEDRWNLYIGVQDAGGAIPSEKKCITLWEQFKPVLDGASLTVDGAVLTISILAGGPFAAKGMNTIYYFQISIYQ